MIDKFKDLLYNVVMDKRRTPINKLTSAKYEERLATINPSTKLHEPFMDFSHKVSAYCTICGYEWEAKAQSLLRSSKYGGCPKCAGRIHRTIEIIKERVARRNPDLEILDTHFKHDNKLHIRCRKCGYEFTSSVQKLENSVVCQNCSSRILKTHEQYVNKWISTDQVEKFNFLSKYINRKTMMTIQCKKCKYTWEVAPQNLSILKNCPSCGIWNSSYEHEIIQWVKTLGISNILHNKYFIIEGHKRYEIDVVLPDYNLGIDFHGLYFHADWCQKRRYHQDKYKFFLSRGIRYIQIFENEWLQKKDIVKSIICNKLGFSKKLYARNTKIVQLTNEQYNQFMDRNHIQGAVKTKIKIGLMLDDQLVCAGGFSKTRFGNGDSFEIIRFATILNTIVIGGFNKILKYFETTYNPPQLISYTDVRYFNGASYTDFEKVALLPPNYFYFRKNELVLYHRVNFQKKKLAKKLEHFDVNKTEYENMIANGWLRIFDAGNLKFVKKY